MRTEKKWGEGTWLDMGEPVAKGFCWQETNTTLFLSNRDIGNCPHIATGEPYVWVDDIFTLCYQE